jgi:DNA-directed RNA polymerase III subunit RPC3
LKKDDIRTILPKLQIGGILETVEIPKTLERHRNIQLISFHESRARAFVLQDLYKTMVRIYQRLDEERQRRAGILKKAARTDVKKDLMRYLSPSEVRGYRQWKAIEERLLGQIMKVDQSVMLLRDI